MPLDTLFLTSAAPAAKCMLFHGLVSSPKEFSVINNALKRDQVDILCPEIPGYTLQAGFGPARWQDWLQHALAAFDAEVARSGPIMIGGLCIGALLALAIARQRPGQVLGLALLSPTLFYDGWGLSPWRKLRHIGYLPGLRNWIQIKEKPPFGIKNEQIRKWIAREMREQALSGAGAAKLPLWAIHEAEKLIAHTMAQLSHIHAPTLILHAREDEVTSLRSPEYLMRQLASTHKQLIILNNSYHMITLDNDRHRVVKALADFIHPQKVPRNENNPEHNSEHNPGHHQRPDSRQVWHQKSLVAG